MTDINPIFDLYERLRVAKNDYSEYLGNDPHKLNINLLKNDRKQLVDKFCGACSRAFRILAPRLSNMHQLTYVSSVGGHIYLKEPGYDNVQKEYQSCVDKAILYFKLIKSSDHDITQEYAAIESEKAKKLANDFTFSEILKTPVAQATGVQQTLNF